MTLKDKLELVCQTKKSEIKLNGKELKNAKDKFYQDDFKEWQLDLLWELIWNDISLDEIKKNLKIGD